MTNGGVIMGLMNNASTASLWRGYEYYINKHVRNFKKIDDTKFQCNALGSGSAIYDVYIDTEHIRKSHCSCPHANGRRIICKHMIALYFSAFPNEAIQYKKDIDEYEKQEEEYYNELEERVIKYVRSLSKAELQQEFLEILFDGSEWVFDRFVDEHIGWDI